MANVREMVNTHLPFALKLINSAALVAIALSTSVLLALCVRCLAGLLLKRLSLKPTEPDEMERYPVSLQGISPAVASSNLVEFLKKSTSNLLKRLSAAT